MTVAEKFLYLENKRSQNLILLFLMGNTLLTVIYINAMAVDLELGAFVMLNIFLSLIAFLMAVRQKLYDLRWGYGGIALGIFQLLRIFWIPPEIVNPSRLILQVLLLLTAGLALAGSAICIKRARERLQFIDENDINLAIMQK